MKKVPSSPDDTQSLHGESEPHPVVSVVLATFSEDFESRLFRSAFVILTGITGTILLWWYSEGLQLGLFLWIWFLVSVSVRLLRCRSILVGNHDLKTVRGEIDQGIRWADVGSIHVAGTVIELCFPEGGSRSVSLRFLNPVIRDQAATAIIRSLEMFHHAGPLVIPLTEEITISSERLELRPFGPGDVPFYVRLATGPKRLATQLSVMTSDELVAGSMSSLFKKTLLGMLTVRW